MKKLLKILTICLLIQGTSRALEAQVWEGLRNTKDTLQQYWKNTPEWGKYLGAAGVGAGLGALGAQGFGYNHPYRSVLAGAAALPSLYYYLYGRYSDPHCQDQFSLKI